MAQILEFPKENEEIEALKSFFDQYKKGDYKVQYEIQDIERMIKNSEE